MALRTLARPRIGSIYHRDRPFKHIENSPRGVRLAKAAGDPAIDIDLQITKDGVVVACHDNQPMLHGFFDPLHRLPRDMKISDHPWSVVSRLLARTGVRLYRIHRIEDMLRACVRRGRIAVLEPKANREFAEVWPWQQIAGAAQTVNATASVRALRELNGVRHVAAARAVGFQAWLI